MYKLQLPGLASSGVIPSSGVDDVSPTIIRHYKFDNFASQSKRSLCAWVEVASL